MAHNIENRNGKWSFAFAGPRSEIWHTLGEQDPFDWKAAAGHNYRVVKSKAHHVFRGEFVENEWSFLMREDNGHVFGPCTDAYKLDGCQPDEIHDSFDQYIETDPRFTKSAAGTLGYGERIWLTAKFEEDVTVAGDKHIAYLLASTSFDGSFATRHEATLTRVVCQNTLRAAHSTARAVIKNRHTARFNADAVRRELTQVTQSYAEFKAMGDAMARVDMTRVMVRDFFRDLMGVKNVADKDISTRTKNIISDLERDYEVTKMERNSNRDDAWTALQSVTRYVDHDRTVRGSDGTSDGLIAGRFDSATFGSGDVMKGKAMKLLLPMTRERVLIPA